MASRLPSKRRDQLSSKEQEEYDQITELAESGFGKSGDKFVYKSDDGAFVGPFPFILAAPDTGKLYIDLVYSLGRLNLPADAKETAILACGGYFQAAYELYAHKQVAIKIGALSEKQAEMISKNQKPDDLNANCSVAYDVAKSLTTSPGPLSRTLWDKAVEAFGKDGTVALIHYIGLYAYTSITLNAIDAPVPK